jgi:hypothetical protein
MWNRKQRLSSQLMNLLLFLSHTLPKPPKHPLPPQVDLAITKQIMDSPAGQEVKRRGILMVGESGIFTPEDVAFVQDAGVGAILVGESLVKQGDPAAGVKQLLSLQ